ASPAHVIAGAKPSTRSGARRQGPRRASRDRRACAWQPTSDEARHDARGAQTLPPPRPIPSLPPWFQCLLERRARELFAITEEVGVRFPPFVAENLTQLPRGGTVDALLQA